MAPLRAYPAATGSKPHLLVSPEEGGSSWATLQCDGRAYIASVAVDAALAPGDAVLSLCLFTQLAGDLSPSAKAQDQASASLDITAAPLLFDAQCAPCAAEVRLHVRRCKQETGLLLHPQLSTSLLARTPLAALGKDILKAVREGITGVPLIDNTFIALQLHLEARASPEPLLLQVECEEQGHVIGRETMLSFGVDSSLLAPHPSSASTSLSSPSLFQPLMQASIASLEMSFRFTQSSHGTPAFVLVSGPHGSGKTTVGQELCARLAVPFHILSCLETQSSDRGGSQRLLCTLAKAAAFTPSVVVLDDMDWIGSDTAQQLAAFLYEAASQHRAVFVVGLAQDPSCIPLAFRKQSFYGKEIHLAAVHQSMRRDLLVHLLGRDYGLSEADALHLAGNLETRTSGFVVGDFHRLLGCAKHHGHGSAGSSSHAPLSISEVDLAFALNHTAPAILQSFDVTQPKCTWDAVGGYRFIRARVGTVLRSLKDKSFGVLGIEAPSGLLLFGPSGCGKTMLVHAIASEAQLPFIQVKAMNLTSKYLGETEANIRRLFKAARAARPCIVFIDEIDSISGRRGQTLSSTGAEERALSQLLNEIDGIDDSEGVFVVGCTNRPKEGLDEAILRPGRLELHIEVSYPAKEDRAAIISVLSAKTPLEDTVDIDWLSSSTQGYSCAKLHQLFRTAGLHAVGDARVALSKSDLEAAMRSLVVYK